MYLNHLSSLELLDVAELASFADQFATLQIDNALVVRGGDNTYHESPKTAMDSKEIEQNTDMCNFIIITRGSETLYTCRLISKTVFLRGIFGIFILIQEKN